MDNQQELSVQHVELCSTLCGSLDGRGVWGRMDACVCTAESLHRSPETTLLTCYTPIWNIKFKNFSLFHDSKYFSKKCQVFLYNLSAVKVLFYIFIPYHSLRLVFPCYTSLSKDSSVWWSWSILIVLKEMTEDEMVGWHHWFSGHEVEPTPGDGEGQGSLVCPWSRKDSNMTEPLNSN